MSVLPSANVNGSLGFLVAATQRSQDATHIALMTINASKLLHRGIDAAAAANSMSFSGQGRRA
jgi:hypothetical protein